MSHSKITIIDKDTSLEDINSRMAIHFINSRNAKPLLSSKEYWKYHKFISRKRLFLEYLEIFLSGRTISNARDYHVYGAAPRYEGVLKARRLKCLFRALKLFVLLCFSKKYTKDYLPKKHHDAHIE